MSPDDKAPAPAGAAGRIGGEWAVCVIVTALCGWIFFWSAAQSGGFFSREPSGYYGLLTAGFREGHLYADVQPHPGLLALKDPYDPVANAPYRVHDMSFWHGRYYLYFGVTPAVILFWPVVAATGWYPTEPFAVAVFCSCGLVAAAALLGAVRRRHFPRAPLWVLAAGIGVMALGSPVFALTARPRFYEVPIACAFMLQMLMFGAIFGALNSRRRAGMWLAAASLFFGLSVGARPNYLFAGTALLAAWGWLFRRVRGRGRLLACALCPAALCGCGLMTYNKLRFGSVLEFGSHYQLIGEYVRLQPVFNPARLIPSGIQYLFSRGTWERYFPFFWPATGKPYGMIRYLPWCWLAVLAFLPGTAGGARESGERRALAGIVALAFVANFFPLAGYVGTNDRYMADFVPSALLLGGIGSLLLGSEISAKGRWIPAGRAGVAIAAAYSIFIGCSVFAVTCPRPDLRLAVARLADVPVGAWERLWGIAVGGGLRLDLELPPAAPGVTEPLFETGAAPDRRDWLQLSYLAGNRAEADFYHAGLGLVRGRPFAIPAGRRVTLDVYCGSLMPPEGHPAVAGWTSEAYGRASRELRVVADGRDVLHAAIACYESPPQDLRIGFRGWIGDGVADRFSGKVISWRRLPLERPLIPDIAVTRRAPIELKVIFPADRSAGMQPLLATGRGLESDLLYCLYEGPDRVRFALDHSNSGGPRGPAVDYDPAQPCRLEIWMGSLAGPVSETEAPGSVPLSRRVVVLMNGKVALNEEAKFNASDPAEVVIAKNPFDSTVENTFTGLILEGHQAEGFSSLPALHSEGAFGAVDMQVLFPEHALGTAEPLVVTGVTGAGDMLYVNYVDANHVSFGFDHWAVSSLSGPVVTVDYGRPHRLEIAMASLYPPGEAGAWTRRVRVKLDGVGVLDGISACHPSRIEEIQIGKNLIGGSSCGPAFTGGILSLARVPQAE